MDGENGISITVGGEVVVQFDNKGYSFHKKLEVYEDGIFVGNPNEDGPVVLIAPDGIDVADSTGVIQGSFNVEGLLTTGEIIIADENLNAKVIINDINAIFYGKLGLVDSQGETIFYADSSGSYHLVKEHFYAGIEVHTESSGEKTNIAGSTASFWDGVYDFAIGLSDLLLSAFDDEEIEAVAIKKDGTFAFTPPVGSVALTHDAETEETTLAITETNVEIQKSLNIPWGDQGHRFVTTINGFGVLDEQGSFVENWASNPALNPFATGGGGGECCLEDGDPFVWKNSSGQEKFRINNSEISTNLPITINNSANQQRGIINSNGSFEFGTSSSNNIAYSPDGGSPGLTIKGSSINANGGVKVPLSNGNILEITPDDGIRIMHGFAYVAHMNPTGSTYFTGFSTFDGPVYLSEINSYCDINIILGFGCIVVVESDVDATGSVITADAFNESSDKRLKENITPVTNALNLLKGINGYYYNLIDDDDKKRHIGFIAQQIQTALPEVVKSRDNGFMTVAYGHVTALLVEAVKSLHEIVEYQKNLLEAQNDRIIILEREINNLMTVNDEFKEMKTRMLYLNKMLEKIMDSNKDTQDIKTSLNIIGE